MYKKEYLEPKKIQDSQIPGYGPNRLDEKSLFIDNIATGGNYYASNTTFATTGVKTITGVGFLPKHIKLTAFISGTNQGGSDGYYNNGNVYCRYTYVTGGNSVYGGVGYSIYCYSAYSGGNVSIATTVTPISDGFTINVTTVAGGTISLLYECFG